MLGEVLHSVLMHTSCGTEAAYSETQYDFLHGDKMIIFLCALTVHILTKHSVQLFTIAEIVHMGSLYLKRTC